MADFWQWLEPVWQWVEPMLPFSVLSLIFILGLAALNKFLYQQAKEKTGVKFRYQLIFTGTVISALIILLIAVPINDELRGQLFSLLGIMVSAIIALSSTTIVGNMMAGLFLRSIHSFDIGDFLKINEHFGRISEIGLLHVEIQTEDRDLKTLPNLFLNNQPFTVIHGTGTIISSEVSLGYDVDRKILEKLLSEAAAQAELEDPFVQIMALGDFSITYRVGGMLTEVRHLISSRSKLRAAILDILHSNGIEIASPTLMNQRQFPKETKFVPSTPAIVELASEPANPEVAKIEDIMFDKAERASRFDRLRKRLDHNVSLIIELEKDLSNNKDDQQKVKIKRKISLFQNQNERLKKYFKEVEKNKQSREKNKDRSAKEQIS